MSILVALVAAQLANCTAVDGDTLKCIDLTTHRETRVRLTSIDAPELPTSPRARKCRYTECPRGNPYYSKQALQRAVRGKTLYIEELDRDQWARRIANVKAAGASSSLSCQLIKDGYATYKPDWDRKNHNVLQHTCPYVRRNYRYDGRKAK
jgi:endonuclease YncB( thermonuclease family)